MKKLLIAAALFLTSANAATAQKDEIAQLVLNVQKLAQFRSILKKMKQGYDILNGGYNTVKNIAEGNFKIHQAFLDGLLEVNPAIKNYKRVGDIVRYQAILIKEYKSAFARFKTSNEFTPEELSYLSRVYSRLFNESLRHLDELLNVITAGKMRMSDDERIKAIDQIYEDMQSKVNFLREFNSNANILAIQRAKEKHDVDKVKKLTVD